MTMLCAMYAYKQSTSKSSYTRKLSGQLHLLSLYIRTSVDRLPPPLEATTDTSSCSSTTTLGGQVYGCYPTRKPKHTQLHIRHFRRRLRLQATPSSGSGAIANERRQGQCSSIRKPQSISRKRQYSRRSTFIDALQTTASESATIGTATKPHTKHPMKCCKHMGSPQSTRTAMRFHTKLPSTIYNDSAAL